MASKSYFSHDSDARNDESIIAVRMKHKAEGYGVYFMLLERLRASADYTSAVSYEMLGYDFRVSAELVRSIVEDFGLFSFTDDGKRFYSAGLMKRMSLMDDKIKKRSEAGKLGGRPKKRVETDSDSDEESKTKANEKQNESKTKANEKQNESKTKANESKTKANEKQNESKTKANESNKTKLNKTKDINISNEIFCDELPAECSPPVEVEYSNFQFLLVGGKTYRIPQADYQKYHDLYPGVNIDQELRNIEGWCESNPTKRKTETGAKAFITRWLTRRQDQGTGGTTPVRGSGKRNQDAGVSFEGHPEVY